MKTYTELTPQERNDLIRTDVLKWERYTHLGEEGWIENNDGDFFTDEDSDFDSDLNACHLVEEKMDADYRWPYLINLSRIVYGGSTASPDFLAAVWPHIHATASQKTEAILRAYNLIS